MKPRIAKYIVTFERATGEEDGQNYLGVTDEKSAIQQLRKEIQEAYDEGILSGNFNIESRTEQDIETPSARLEYLRGELRAERISTGELAELQDLAPHIDPDDVELLEAAGVPEFPEETGHTPAPWKITDTDEEGHFTIESQDGGTCIAYGAGFYGEDSPGKANARLIAAAPTMLAALQAARACLYNLQTSQRWDKEEGDHIEEGFDTMEEINAAIARATA